MRLHKLPNNWVLGPFKKRWKRIAFHIGLAAIAAILIQAFMNDLTWTSFLKTTCLAVANDFAMTIGHVYIFRNLDLNYDWLKNTYRRLILSTIFHTIYSVVIFLLLQLILFSLLFGLNSQEIITWTMNHWWLPIGVTALVIVFTTTVGFFEKWKSSLIAEEEARAEMMAYKFESLKSQVNPSFLFDILNSLKEVIQSDQKKAVQVIQKMSRLYRSVLESKDMELISLEDEMKQLDLYVELLKIRYGDRLEIESAIIPETNERVVPVALQNVVELFIKGIENGIPTKRTIAVNRSGHYLRVSTQSSGAEEINKTFGESVELLAQRYKFFTEKTIKMEADDQNVSISIPILNETL